MSTTLKALETLALERGRVSAGETFTLHSKESAAALVAAGLAETVADEKDAKSLDAKPDAAKGSVTVKQEKEPVKTKEEKTPVETKEEK